MNIFVFRFLVSIVALVGFSLATHCGCSKHMTQVPTEPKITSWVYWLQNPDIEKIASSEGDVVVIDYSSNGRDKKAFTPAEVALLKGRIVLAYLSIGEAEVYRFYWKQAWKNEPPEFLGPENPDWPGNYKVRYWQEAWWDTALQPYLDRILAAGFDGVYLDIIDAYWFWHEEGRDLRQAADEMVALVQRIAAYTSARSERPFLICPQNGLPLLEDASPATARRFLDTADLFGEESLFFNIYSLDDQHARLRQVRRALDAGKTVLSVEYIGPERVQEYRRRAASYRGLVPFAADPDAKLASLPRHGVGSAD